jgi:hypothetical protein
MSCVQSVAPYARAVDRIMASAIKDCQAARVIDGLKVRQAFLPVAEWWGDGVPA